MNDTDFNEDLGGVDDAVDETQEIDDTIRFLKNVNSINAQNKEEVDSRFRGARSSVRTVLKNNVDEYEKLRSDITRFENDEKNKIHLKEGSHVPKSYNDKYKRVNELLGKIAQFDVYEQQLLVNYARIYKASFNLDKYTNIQAEVLKQLENINNKYSEMMKTQMDKTIEMHEKDTEKHFTNMEKMMGIYNDRLSESVRLVSIGLHRITDVLIEIKPKLLSYTEHLRPQTPTYHEQQNEVFAPIPKNETKPVNHVIEKMKQDFKDNRNAKTIIPELSREQMDKIKENNKDQYDYLREEIKSRD